MDTDQLLEEAQNCRRQALAYVGNPEAPFLLRVASAFEDLARNRGPACAPISDPELNQPQPTALMQG